SVKAGSRTAGFTVSLNAHDSFNKRVTVSAISAGADLPPGSGEVLVFYFTIADAVLGGVSGNITTPPGNALYIATDAVAFPPVFVPGTVSSRYVLRGDCDGDGKINIRDVIFVLNGIFLSGPQPVTAQAADANGDGSTNIADATYLINYIFTGGPPPPTP
ncbi:MAG TPA: dockerin type I repeat-containing protein, partial [candidate division Zixibacteria bacterium]|nr:dockerin type I repeat-containing protein [candidate division Zixibacteria bacterium]